MDGWPSCRIAFGLARGTLAGMADQSVTETPAPIVFWRPGCGFCAMLERRLSSAGVPYQRRNIWEDAEAAEFVRAMNDGNETVPTVVIGTDVYTNPPASVVLERLGVEPPEGPFSRLSTR